MRLDVLRVNLVLLLRDRVGIEIGLGWIEDGVVVHQLGRGARRTAVPNRIICK
jgi:hypothetical protein